MKQSHAYKGYASIYSVEILNSFNSELQVEDTESTIKNKLIEVLSALRRFTKLVWEFKKIENNDKMIYSTFKNKAYI